MKILARVFVLGASALTLISGAPNARADVAVHQGAVIAYAGDVTVRSDGEGRLAVVLDEQRNMSSLPDGITDRVFLFTPGTPLRERLELHLPAATLIRGEGRLEAVSATTGVRVSLRLSGSRPGSGAQALRHEVSDRLVALEDGLGIIEAAGNWGGQTPADIST